MKRRKVLDCMEGSVSCYFVLVLKGVDPQTHIKEVLRDLSILQKKDRLIGIRSENQHNMVTWVSLLQ